MEPDTENVVKETPPCVGVRFDLERILDSNLCMETTEYDGDILVPNSSTRNLEVHLLTELKKS